MRTLLITLILTLFAASLGAQPFDLPDRDKSNKESQQDHGSGGLGRTRGRTTGGDKRGEADDENEDEGGQEANNRRRKDRYD